MADVLTPNARYDDYVRTYLDWTYRLSDAYVPPDLVNVGTGGPYIAPRAVEAVGAADVLARRGDPSYSTLLTDAPDAAVRRLAYPDLAAMRAAARAAGQQLVILSAYRSGPVASLTASYARSGRFVRREVGSTPANARKSVMRKAAPGR